MKEEIRRIDEWKREGEKSKIEGGRVYICSHACTKDQIGLNCCTRSFELSTNCLLTS